ncbi:MAG: DUF6588 family protein [Nitrososphaerales archaeon]
MKKGIFLFLFILSFQFNISFGQVGLGIFGLAPDDAGNYSKPMATFLGTYFNSGAYYSAELPETFQFKFSIIGMYTFVPDGQTTFTPNPGVSGYSNSGSTATFVGGDGSYQIGPGGFLAYPGGFNVSSVPSGIYQIAGSFFRTELMLRYFPSSTFSDVKSGFWGIGLKHDFSQLFSSLTFNIALQVLYNTFSLDYVGDDPTSYINMESENIAINVQGSKTFEGMFIVYGGLQYESSSMDLSYYFRDPNELYPSIANTVQNTSVDGDNVFRFTAGGAIQLMPVVFNLDFNITSMFTITGGISLQI